MAAQFFPIQPLNFCVYKRMGNEIMSSSCCLHVVHPSFSYGYVLQMAVIAGNLHKKKSSCTYRSAGIASSILQDKPYV